MALFGSFLAFAVADQEGLVFRDALERSCLYRSALRLSGNSALWLLLDGAARERRVIKFGYGTDVSPPPIVARQDVVITRGDKFHGETVELKELGEGRILWRETIRRAARRFAAMLGLGALEISIPVPNVTEPMSYHFELEGPPGLEVRRLRLRARLIDENGQEVRPRTQYEGRTGHLYFADVEAVQPPHGSQAGQPPGPGVEVPRQPVSIDAALGIARRGFMDYAVVSAIVIAGGLWGYAASSREAVNDHHLDVAGAVLLIVPALLVVFSVRPEEHAWASRLLAGVRGMVFISGLLAALAAAALIGVSPFSRPGDALTTYAIAASVPAIILLLAWIGLWEPAKWWLRRSPDRYQYGAGAFLALSLLVVLAAARWLGNSTFKQPSVAIPVAAVAFGVLASWSSLGTREESTVVTIDQRVWTVFCGGIVGALGLAAAILNLPTSSGIWGFLTVATTFACVGIGVTTLFGGRQG